MISTLNGLLSILIKSLLTLCLATLVGCIQEPLILPSVGSSQISGKFEGYGTPSHNQKKSDITSLDCTSPSAFLYKLDADGSRIEPPLATSSLDSNGNYSFDTKQAQLKLKGKSPKEALFIQISGCNSGVYFRPVTGASDQNVTMGSTLIGFLLNTNQKELLSSVLVNRPSDLEALFTELSTAKSLHEAHDIFINSAPVATHFNSLFGMAPSALNNAAPEIISTTIPKSLSELVTATLSASASHFLPDYKIVYEWSLDGTLIGTTSNISFTPHANLQGSHTLKLTLGEDNGSGRINTQLPTKVFQTDLNISNNIPPEAPSFSLISPIASGSGPINTRQITLSINTGANTSNCASFTSLAITENQNSAPDDSSFTLSCNNAGNQNLIYNIMSPGDGSKVLSLWARDASGTKSNQSKNLSVTLDTTAPRVSITSGPGNLTNSPQQIFNFSAIDGDQAVDHIECQIDSASFSLCTSPLHLSSLTQGVHTFNLRSIDKAGNISPVESRSWTVDLTPPALSITTAPNAITNQLTSTISFTSSDLGGGVIAGFLCNMDNAGFESCMSPSSKTLVAGSHSLIVKSIDTAGNISNPETISWVIDTTAPTINVVSKPASLTNSTSATFSFVGSDTGGGSVKSYECQIDNGGYTACTSPKTYTGLSQAAHNFDVRAIDTANNIGAAVRSSWTIDLTTPLASILSAPGALTNASSATFTFSATPPPDGSITGYECNLDNTTWTACSSPKAYSALASGTHSFQVRSVDNNNNRSATTSHSWKIDLIAPTLTLGPAPEARNNKNLVEFTFSATDDGASPVTNFKCKLDSGAYTACSSPIQYNALSEGSHTFSITATDAAGNTSSAQTSTWVTDLTAPSVSIGSTPTSINNSSTASFAFSATDPAGGAIASYSCSTDGGPSSLCSSPQNLSGLSEGIHQFAVIAKDNAGNSSAAATFTWTIDQTSPTISFTSSPSTITNIATATLSFSANDSGGGAIASYSCKLDSGSFTTCTSPASYTSLSNGAHSFSVKATDTANNTSSVITASWTIDTTPPVVAISTPSSNNFTVSTSQLSNFLIAGTCSESDQVVTLSGALSATLVCSGGQWSKNLDLTSLADGTLSITASQTDAAGNTTTSTPRTLIKDTLAPIIAINNPGALQGGITTNTLSWTLTESNVGAGANFNLELFDGTSWSALGSKSATPGNNSSQSYSYTVPSTPSVDTNNAKIRISFTDAAGNAVTTTSGSFIIDTTPPSLSFVTINNGATYAGSSIVNVQVGVSDTLSGSSISVRLASATAQGECQSQYSDSGWVPWTSPTQNLAFTISPVDGTKKICAWAKDAVGNVTIMSPTTGTAGVTYSTIIRQASSPPQMTGFNVYNTNDNSNTFALNDPITITWSASGLAGLDNNPLSLSYSTNGTTWYDIVTKADSSISSNITWLGGLSGTPTSASGTYTSFKAPTNGYFIIKALARDVAGNMSVAVMSQPQNTGKWSVFAGNTDRGDNGSGLSAALYSDGASSAGRNVAINPLTNDIYAMDHGYGIRKLNIQTGVVSTFIPTGTLNLPNSGTLSSTSRVNVSGASSMLIDSNGIMYYASYTSNSAAKIYKINLATNQVTFYLGGGTSNSASATPSTIYVSVGAMDLDANNNLYFLTSCDTTSPTHLTPKKLMRVQQNTDGSAGAITEIAGGTCSLGTPVAGQPAISQPLTAGSAYSQLSTIAAINSNFIYFSGYGNAPIKIINGVIYSTNLGTNSGMGVVTYNRATNRIYRAISGYSFGYFTPNNSGNGGEVLTPVAASNGPGNCVSDGVDASSACVTVDSGFNFDSNGLVYFSDGYKNNAPNGYRVRYVDTNNQIRTIMGSLPFYGDGLHKGLIRGTIGGIYYKKSTELNQSAFPAGLYLVSPFVVFGRINETDQVYKTLWGNQQGNSYAAPTGTTISSTLSMGTAYAGGNGKALTFDSDGLPWLRASNQLVQIDSSNKINIKADASGSWWENGGAPATSSMWVFGGYQNLTLKGAIGAFFIGGYSNPLPLYNPNPQIRFLDFANALNTKVIGGSYLASQSTTMSSDISTPGNVQAAPLSSGCINTAACSIQYINSQDRLYFINPGDSYIRYITNPTTPTASTLTTLSTPMPNSSIINFIFKEDLSQIFLLDKNGGLYCMDISSNKSWCNNSTNLYPYSSTMGTFTYGPNQMTWKDANTLLISNYKGQILQYTLPP